MEVSALSEKRTEIGVWLNQNKIKYGRKQFDFILLNEQDIMAVKLQFE